MVIVNTDGYAQPLSFFTTFTTLHCLLFCIDCIVFSGYIEAENIVIKMGLVHIILTHLSNEFLQRQMFSGNFEKLKLS